VAVWRFGLVVKGLLQLLIGLLALAAAFGERHGRITDAAGALRAIAAQPLTRPILLLLSLGLLAYAGLRLVEGLLDPRRRPPVPRTWLYRVGDVVGGVTYILLGIGAARLFMGLGGPPTGDARSRRLAAETLALPYGPKMLVLCALVLGALAALFVARALLVRDVCGDLQKEQMGPVTRRAAAVMIRVASGLQALLFGTMATLVYRAAQLHDARAVRGMGGVLRFLGARPGTAILALLAIGFVIMSGTSFIEARWRKLT
jgi:hypothetical protein